MTGTGRSRIGIRASAFGGTSMMAISASLLRAGDLVLASSHSGRATGVLEAIQIAQAKGASMISITSYEVSPLAAISDVVLCSTAMGSPLTSENAAARIAQLNIVDSIFMAVAQKSYRSAEDNLVETMAAVQSKRHEQTSHKPPIGDRLA